ncbi:pectinesterase inhibitor 6-like [Chenopodium quinoa]|uniref:pectinesterase inhibitor 6-like n=1 Tax=Chenopodium quinoa TaxID=63459 RepID=UPI000B7745D1|nr:pectinesterase inhibitor 6-like [Chenopodium quinoa]
MQPIFTLSILSLLFTFIYQVQCRSLSETISLISPPTSLETTAFVIPPSPSPSNAAAPYNDPSYALSPSSTPIAMQDADGDPIDLPITFNPFDLNHDQQEESSTTTNTAVNNPDVKKTCDATDNPDLCISSLKPFLMHNNNDGSKKTDTFSLLGMQVKATQQATQLALALSTKKLGQTDNDMDVLRDCREMYDNALDNLDKVIKALESKDIGTINSMLSATISDFGTCDDGVKESGGTSPLVGYGNKLTELVSNCLATVSLIKDDGATA